MFNLNYLKQKTTFTQNDDVFTCIDNYANINELTDQTICDCLKRDVYNNNIQRKNPNNIDVLTGEVFGYKYVLGSYKKELNSEFDMHNNNESCFCPPKQKNLAIRYNTISKNKMNSILLNIHQGGTIKFGNFGQPIEFNYATGWYGSSGGMPKAPKN